MNKIPKKWLRILPLLALLFLIVSLVENRMELKAPLQKPTQPVTDNPTGHNHEADATAMMAEGSQGMNDPVKQRRMGIHHFNEGNRSLGEGQYDQAIHNYEMALNHDPEIHEVYVNLSTVYLKQQDFDRASQTLKTLQTKKPDLPALHYNLACYYSLTRQTDLSLKALKKAWDLGYPRAEDIKTDPDLNRVRQTPGYQEWVKTL